ncbi:hypothetical protein GCM10010360_01090 [Streptomyces nogalater]
MGAEEPLGEGFDLVHARLVLVHVPDPERALRSPITSLRPGGRLLSEDADPALQPLIRPGLPQTAPPGPLGTTSPAHGKA